MKEYEKKYISTKSKEILNNMSYYKNTQKLSDTQNVIV